MLDTPVLVYAVGVEHPLRRPATGLVQRIADARIRATTTIEVVQEFAHVRARRHGRADAAALARHYATLLAPLLVTEAADLEDGLRLFARHDRLGSFDAVLAAAAARIEPDALVSSDRAFADVDGLRFVDLAEVEALSDG